MEHIESTRPGQVAKKNRGGRGDERTAAVWSRVRTARRLLAAGVDPSDAAARGDLPEQMVRRLGIRDMVAALAARLDMGRALEASAGG